MRRACVFFVVMAIAFAAVAVAQKKPPAKPLDINNASVEQLQQLPGVGPVIAKSILDFREKSGPFRRVEELLAIRGISEARFKAIVPYVTVSPAKPAASPKNADAPSKPAAAAKPATGAERARREAVTRVVGVSVANSFL